MWILATVKTYNTCASRQQRQTEAVDEATTRKAR